VNKTEKIKSYLADNPFEQTKNVAAKLNVSRRLVRLVKQTNTQPKTAAKILSVDIETSPMETYVWGIFKQRIPDTNIIKDWSMLSWSAKWLGEDTIMSQRVTQEEAMERKDNSIVHKLWELLNEANLVIAHNAIRFDIRKINARFLVNGLTPPSSYQVLDTLKQSQKNFGFASHKLNYLVSTLIYDEKLHTSFDLWKQCVTGSSHALRYMEKYNQHDVRILEQIYLLIRPWVKSHMNMGLFNTNDCMVCTNCGSSNIVAIKNMYVTPANKYKEYRCLHCGAHFREPKSNITKEQRKTLLTPNAH